MSVGGMPTLMFLNGVPHCHVPCHELGLEVAVLPTRNVTEGTLREVSEIQNCVRYVVGQNWPPVYLSTLGKYLTCRYGNRQTGEPLTTKFLSCPRS